MQRALLTPGVIGISAWFVAIHLYYIAHKYLGATDQAIMINSFILAAATGLGLAAASVFHHWTSGER